MANYGEGWREHRRFASKISAHIWRNLLVYTIICDTFNLYINIVHLCNHMFSGRSHISFISTSLPGKSIDPEHLYHQAASNIIASIIFGSRFNYQDEYFQTLITNLEKLTKIAIGQWAMVNTMKSLDTVYLHWMQIGSLAIYTNSAHCITSIYILCKQDAFCTLLLFILSSLHLQYIMDRMLTDIWFDFFNVLF